MILNHDYTLVIEVTDINTVSIYRSHNYTMILNHDYTLVIEVTDINPLTGAELYTGCEGYLRTCYFRFIANPNHL